MKRQLSIQALVCGHLPQLSESDSAFDRLITLVDRIKAEPQRFGVFKNDMIAKALAGYCQSDLSIDQCLDKLHATLTKGNLEQVAEHFVPRVPSSTGSGRPSGFTKMFEDMDLHKGIGLLVAGMSAFGAIDSARRVLSKDEQGHTHVNMTPLAWALAQGALATGIAYVTLRAPQVMAR